MFYKTPPRPLFYDSQLIYVGFLNDERFISVSESGEVAVWSSKLKKLIYSLSASSTNADLFVLNHKQDQFVILERNDPTYVDSRIGQHRTINTRSRSHLQRWLGVYRDQLLTELMDTHPQLRIWTLADGRLVKDVEMPRTGLILALYFSPDDTMLVMNDHLAIFLLDVEAGIMTDRIPLICKLLGFTDDGQNLILQQDNQIKIWNIAQERFYKNFAFNEEIYFTQLLSNNHIIVVLVDYKDYELIVHTIDLGVLIVDE